MSAVAFFTIIPKAKIVPEPALVLAHSCEQPIWKMERCTDDSSDCDPLDEKHDGWGPR